MSDERTFLNKSRSQIRDEILDITQAEVGLKNHKPIGALRGLVEVYTRVVHGFYQAALNKIYAQADPEKKTGFWLDLWGLQSGVKRKRAVTAEGNVTVTTYASGTIPKGAWMKAQGTSVRFKVTKDISFHASTFTVQVQAEHPGGRYNLGSGVTMIFTKVIYGMDAAVTKVGWITRQGRDSEGDTDFAKRIKLKWASLGQGNPPARYVQEAKKVAGVKEVKVIRTPRGEGTTDMFLVSSNGEKPPAVKKAVEKAIKDSGMICRDLLVKWALDLKRNFHIEFTGPYTANQVELKAREFILRIPMGGTLEARKFYSYLDEQFPLVKRLEVVEPTRDITASGTAQRVEKIIPPSADDTSGFYFKVIKND